ncbi:hypothetical protein BC835DRAFT_201368 [Cytidiella melzeri]|nr:hypothetical protein BC835DRAFT_201368 [Cytidiella melzeri]
MVPYRIVTDSPQCLLRRTGPSHCQSCGPLKMQHPMYCSACATLSTVRGYGRAAKNSKSNGKCAVSKLSETSSWKGRMLVYAKKPSGPSQLLRDPGYRIAQQNATRIALLRTHGDLSDTHAETAMPVIIFSQCCHLFAVLDRETANRLSRRARASALDTVSNEHYAVCGKRLGRLEIRADEFARLMPNKGMRAEAA